VKEIVIASGKGGTGKTSVSAAFAFLAASDGKAAFADCDVDAADFHLVLRPEIRERHPFVSGAEAVIDPAACSACGKCAQACRFGGIRRSGAAYAVVSCEGCGLCERLCPARAISLVPRECGEWFRSSTRFGPFAHARLRPLAENSGKLVSLVRKEARAAGEESGADLLIVDGCPGIGCPVISSITGADALVAVAEPSPSGLHDLERLIQLAGRFRVSVAVIMNKSDINPEASDALERDCRDRGIPFLGRIPYSADFTRAQLEGRSVMECAPDGDAALRTRDAWEALAALWA
jgi:MinD superfamily P-loop ATPase